MDWCEANYVHTRYVAEFFNTMSSIPMLVVSIWGLYLCFKYQLELRFYLCWLGIGVVGIGSVAFHGTLHPTGQAIDELGMICASLAFLYVVLEIGHLEAVQLRSDRSDIPHVSFNVQVWFVWRVLRVRCGCHYGALSTDGLPGMNKAKNIRLFSNVSVVLMKLPTCCTCSGCFSNL